MSNVMEKSRRGRKRLIIILNFIIIQCQKLKSWETRALRLRHTTQGIATAWCNGQLSRHGLYESWSLGKGRIGGSGATFNEFMNMFHQKFLALRFTPFFDADQTIEGPKHRWRVSDDLPGLRWGFPDFLKTTPTLQPSKRASPNLSQEIILRISVRPHHLS